MNQVGILKLSPRQRVIIELLANGYHIKKIAEMLCIETVTVDKHIKKAKKQLSAKTTPHCVALAIVSGQISLSPALDETVNQRPNGGNGDEQNE